MAARHRRKPHPHTHHTQHTSDLNSSQRRPIGRSRLAQNKDSVCSNQTVGTNKLCLRGGSSRRAPLRSVCPKGRGSATLLVGTKILELTEGLLDHSGCRESNRPWKPYPYPRFWGGAEAATEIPILRKRVQFSPVPLFETFSRRPRREERRVKGYPSAYMLPPLGGCGCWTPAVHFCGSP